MDAGTLHTAIAEVCPVDSVKVEIADTRSSWSFVPGAAATQPQIDAGNNVIQTIPVAVLTPLEPGEFISRFTAAEYLLLEQKKQTDLAADDASFSRVWDIVIGANNLNLNSTNASDLKAMLVTGGILTQARADEIFGQGGTVGTSMVKWKV